MPQERIDVDYVDNLEFVKHKTSFPFIDLNR